MILTLLEVTRYCAFIHSRVFLLGASGFLLPSFTPAFVLLRLLFYCGFCFGFTSTSLRSAQLSSGRFLSASNFQFN
ncbi:hypothetical protein BZA77DRAFT_320822 [Pyronema omphalodes]|nr:hypothetical protein BZA77DRAFT_320822 [Pyronema omphalodes]